MARANFRAGKSIIGKKRKRIEPLYVIAIIDIILLTSIGLRVYGVL